MARVLCVQPGFPIPNKSHYHRDYLPIGLLKLATWREGLGDSVALSLGDLRTDFEPDEIYVTSLFTYWSSHVREAVQHYRAAFPEAFITVGGIYASLQLEHCEEYTGCDAVWRGVHPDAEQCEPDYSLVQSTFQILHASRGCTRRCRFCGTYQIEPEFLPKRSIGGEISKNHLIFYDNNFLANQYIENILEEIREKRVDGKIVHHECQSGLDGRILLQKPHLAELLKAAHFKSPRIAWDGPYGDHEAVHDQLQVLLGAGFPPREIQVFMLYNHRLPPAELFAKVEKCYQWGVQVSDCRFRPLDSFSDGYNPRARHQRESEYYVHPGWSDAEVRSLRRTVRTNNICVRYHIPRDRYVQKYERFSRAQKRSIAQQLGFEDPRLDDSQLDAINQAWRAAHGRSDSAVASTLSD